jgi:pimeloyl-ACP methyl ester carboxylesterase
MPHVTINGSALHVETEGEGEPIVLVHGSWSAAAVWAAVAAELRSSFTVTAYDRLGHTASERPATAPTRLRHEDDLVALVEHLDAGPAHIVASSFGGSIALAAAARRPDLFRTIVAHEPPLVGLIDGPARAELIAASTAIADRIAAGDVLGGTRTFFEELAIGPGGWDVLPEPFREMALDNAPTFVAEQLSPDWASLTEPVPSDIPVLLTEGGLSPAWFGQTADAVAAFVPHAERLTMADAAHGPHASHPAEYAAMIERFVSGDRVVA